MARFLRDELKPFIDGTYRTRPEAEFTGLGGSSLGGLATLSLGLWFPEIFNRLAVMSPSIWWDDCVIYRMLDKLKEKPPLKIWLDTGTNEPGWERARDLRDRLVERGWRVDDDLQYTEVEGGDHSEGAWGARFEAVLRYLYPPLPPGMTERPPKPMVLERRFVRREAGARFHSVIPSPAKRGEGPPKPPPALLPRRRPHVPCEVLRRLRDSG